ncbi:hypothetical protein AGMMS50229_10120 [Campylobacterota bacterium]|nr:hypothetical protein AGMMS50229_10120 [Campylobacterota bacterium]
MTNTASVRQEMHRRIDLMPKRELLKLQEITAELDDTELTPSEKKTVKRNLERFKEHPEEFVSWKKIRDAL